MILDKHSKSNVSTAPKRLLKRLSYGFFNTVDCRPELFALSVSFLLALIIEILGRRSPAAAVWFMLSSPHVFTANVLIIFISLIPATLPDKRLFYVSLISAIWLTLGIAECVVLSFRTTPIGAVDFSILLSVLPIIDFYFTVPQIILIGAGISGAIALMVLLAVKSPVSSRGNLMRRILIALLIIVMCLAFIFIARYTGFLGTEFPNLAAAYNDFGFPYCFSISLFDRGINRPDDYSSELVDDIINDIEDISSEDAQPVTENLYELPEAPNIIFLQMESFFDVGYMRNADYSVDPLPNFNSLKAAYPSGFLTVPTIGAGTANVEFEVLCGMPLTFFGVGEYPYKTILKDETCETVCYNLKERGYTSTAIHNNTAAFYDRHLVYCNLGFDRFESIEFMQELSYTQVGWARDEVLTDEILKAMYTTDTPDLLFTISVQGHGKYPTEASSEMEVDVSGVYEDEPVSFEYYVNQLHEDDIFLSELTSALTEYPEPVLLVIYGDHLPGFEIDDESLDGCSRFETEYVIWSNYGLVGEDKDLCAYQLASHVMELCGFDNGYLNRFHQRLEGSETYMDDLEILCYDMLYGDHELWDGECPYEPTELKFGYGTIQVSGAEVINSSLYVSGNNFTRYSVVYDGDEPLKTVYINSHALLCSDYEPENGTVISVHQVTDDRVDLLGGDEIVYTAPEEISEAEDNTSDDVKPDADVK